MAGISGRQAEGISMKKWRARFLGISLATAVAAAATLAPGSAAAATGGGGVTVEAMRNDPAMPSVSPAGYDVTIVVFSDYQCPYCRKLHGVLKQVLREDRKIRVVYRDWPIFGPASVEAARTALAVKYQGKHAAFNDALMETPGRIDSQAIQQAVQRAGVDAKRLKSDLATHRAEIDAALGRTAKFADVMDLSGTPALVVGSYLLAGAPEVDALRKAVAMARKPPTGAV
jgi:protein-disulfide isomerase